MTQHLEPGNTPVVCGHRGAPPIEPENTMASFHAAIERGATWLEFDVRPSLDGALVIHHDPDTASGQNIASTSFADLDDKAIPEFVELAQGLPSVGLDIEMKTDDIGVSLEEYADLVVAEIQAHVVTNEVMVTSFDAEALELVRDRAPHLATGLLFHDRPGSWAIETAVAAGHAAIAPWIKILTADMARDARAAGLQVMTWTVNEPLQVALAAEVGVDMIIGDDPAVIIENL